MRSSVSVIKGGEALTKNIMASTEESDKHEGVAEDDFEVFVNLLQEHTIMFDKQKTPGVRKKKGGSS